MLMTPAADDKWCFRVLAIFVQLPCDCGLVFWIGDQAPRAGVDLKQVRLVSPVAFSSAFGQDFDVPFRSVTTDAGCFGSAPKDVCHLS